MDYIDRFNRFVSKNHVYIKRIVENRWGYWGKQPRDWAIESIKKARGWLIANPKRGNKYTDWGRFLGNWMNRGYNFERPQDVKTYISNEQEINHYKEKRK